MTMTLNVSKGVEDQHDKYEKPSSALIEDFKFWFHNIQKYLDELKEIEENLEALKER